MFSKNRASLGAALVVLAAASFGRGGEPSDWKEKLHAFAAAHPGQVGLAVKHLETGAGFEHQADLPLPTASLIKFPVMVEAYRQAADGKLSLDRMVSLRQEDKVPGSGILTTHFSVGANFCVRDAIRLMIVFSDNTATNLVVDQVGLPTTAATMESLDCPNTKLHSKVFRRDTSIFPERSKEFGLGSTTANEMVRLLEKLHRRELVSPQASDEMLGHLLLCDDKATFRRGLPANAKVAHKTGAVTGVRTDAGILFTASGPIALCVLTNRNQRRPGDVEEPGERLCAAVARTVFEHFNPPGKSPPADKWPALKIGASGEAVVTLQRLLNERLGPAEQIDSDGEFGPQTEGVLKAFQKLRSLKPTGVVDAETWRRLEIVDK